MAKIFIINGHQPHPVSPGNLNEAFVERAEAFFHKRGDDVRKTAVSEGYDVPAEIEKLKWADIVFFQSPINWMGVSWVMKKYIDDVWTAGMAGDLSVGDGRSSKNPKSGYGLGPKLSGKYMMSFTANAPREAFNDPEQKFFEGLSEDELMRPMHLNFKWTGLEPLATYVIYDVLKNPDIDADFARFEKHLSNEFAEMEDAA
ncbi:flavodoxin [Sulfitobacter sp. EhC04]|uniref:NAD(P)H-dependent oxidoreductase n=1 Tax=Sulfitobacter sp. EhC04 TaxID=1849168 RepID=UPI0007F45054|nr:NAD(P)H-dependent oxidoreductase [Sulfitobacter sp. EhC04]OAN76880.1 flavodoxin [Sulfitobacter sp. EhC04]